MGEGCGVGLDRGGRLARLLVDHVGHIRIGRDATEAKVVERVRSTQLVESYGSRSGRTATRLGTRWRCSIFPRRFSATLIAWMSSGAKGCRGLAGRSLPGRHLVRWMRSSARSRSGSGPISYRCHRLRRPTATDCWRCRAWLSGMQQALKSPGSRKRTKERLPRRGLWSLIEGSKSNHVAGAFSVTRETGGGTYQRFAGKAAG